MPPAAPPSSTQRTAEARDAFLASLSSVGASIDADLLARAKDTHANSKALAKQHDEVRRETKAFSKDLDSLQKLLDKTKKDEAGAEEDDLAALLASVDDDYAMLLETVKLAEEEELDDNDNHGTAHHSVPSA
jgi:septal ring factor EnvC (AmiA/AmiB activator)